MLFHWSIRRYPHKNLNINWKFFLIVPSVLGQKFSSCNRIWNKIVYWIKPSHLLNITHIYFMWTFGCIVLLSSLTHIILSSKHSNEHGIRLIFSLILYTQHSANLNTVNPNEWIEKIIHVVFSICFMFAYFLSKSLFKFLIDVAFLHTQQIWIIIIKKPFN